MGRSSTASKRPCATPPAPGDDVKPPTLSIVAPVYNEARILPEFVARCTRAAERCGQPFELVLVDDASTDDTPALLASLARDGSVRALRLASNAGQFRATQAGLRDARGESVLVLDADLQDPPEAIPQLVRALETADPIVGAVLAVKSQRDDPFLFMLGQFVFHRLQHALSRVAVPNGAGAYCLMRRAIAERVARAECGHANLAAVVAVAVSAAGGRVETVTYEKAARYDGRGRVGWAGLIREALDSLTITGALPRLLALAAAAFGVATLAARGHPLARALLAAGCAAAAIASVGTSRQTRHRMAGVRAAGCPENG
jgi:polyisoprenyl-phosphate glycosyltransferase